MVHHKPTSISLFLSKSKTDLYGKAITLSVGATGSHLYPVAAVLAYLAFSPSTPGPLFLFWYPFVTRLKKYL